MWNLKTKPGFLLLGYAGTVTGSGIVKLKAMSLGTHVELEDEVEFPTTSSRLVC